MNNNVNRSVIDLVYYLATPEVSESLFDKDLDTESSIEILYREFYIFLGPETNRNWYPAFVEMAQRLAKGRNEPFTKYLAYLRTIKFKDFAERLERELK